MDLQVLVFRDVNRLLRFLKRNRDKVAMVIVVVDASPQQAGALKRHYDALVVSGLILMGGVEGNGQQ